ncbi:7113_t:CDS:2, partial [Diversispora eburnea]
ISESSLSQSSSQSVSPHKIIVHSSYGPMDNYILSDRHLLEGKILKKTVENSYELMESALREDPVDIILTFDE